MTNKKQNKKRGEVGDLETKPLLKKPGRLDPKDLSNIDKQLEDLAKFPQENPNPVLRVDRDGIILFANNACSKLFIKCRAGRLLPSRYRRPVTEALRTGLLKVIEVKARGCIFRLDIVPVIDAGYANIYGLDITELRQTEEALKENQKDLNRAQSVAQAGSWRMDVQRNVLLWSDENHRIFGIPKGTAMTYETFLGCVHPDDREYVDGKWQAALQGEKYDIEHRIVKGNIVRWVREKAGLEFDRQGMLKGGFGTTQDITERKEMETRIAQLLQERNKQLQQSQTNFQLLVQTMAEGVLVVDNRGYVKFANPAAANIYNLPKKGFDNYYFGIPDNLGVSEIKVPVKDEVKVLELNAAGIVWGDEQGYLITLRDITRLKQSNERIRMLSHRLVEAQESTRREMGRELHDEVGGALTAVKLALGRAQKKLGDMSISELKLANDLLDETMDLVSTLSQHLRPEILNEFGLLEALNWHFERYTSQTGISVDFKHELLTERYPEPVENTAYRIIQESLTNVARYAGVDRVKVVARSDSERLYLQIEDNGCGFDLQQIEKRAIGINGMQDRAYLVGGKVVIDSSPGRGSRITCELPLAGTIIL